MSTPSNQLPRGQDWFIASMKEIGYQADPEGVCLGVAHKAKDAILAQDLETFIKRFELIQELTQSQLNNNHKGLTKLINEIQRVKQKITQLIAVARAETQKSGVEEKAKKLLVEEAESKKQDLDLARLTDEQKKRLDHFINSVLQENIDIRLAEGLSEKERLIQSIPLFFEGVELYMQSHTYPDFFERTNRPMSQIEWEPALALVSPVALDIKKQAEGQEKIEIGQTQIEGSLGMYTQKELVDYFQGLREAFKSFSKPTAFLLLSTNHAVTVALEPSGTWVFIDPNQLPPKLLDNDQAIARHVAKAFFAPNKAHSVAFTNKIFVNSENQQTAKAIVEEWKKQPKIVAMHTITKSKAKSRDVTASSLLHFAASFGNLSIVNDLLKLKKKDGSLLLDINMVNAHLQTPLHLATETGNVEVVNALLDNGADVHPIHKKNRTVLSLAITTNRREIIREWIKRDLITLTIDDFKLAIKADSIDIVEECLDQGLNPMQEVKGETLFHFTAMKGRTDIMKRLLEIKGLDVNQQNNNKTALQVAVESGNIGIVELLLRQPSLDSNLTQFPDDAPLVIAARNGYLDIVDRLIADSSGVNFDPASTTSARALNAAVRNGHFSIVKALLQRGVAFDIEMAFEATRSGNLVMVKYFLDEELIDINATRKKGATLLMESSTNSKVFPELLRRGADINKVTVHGYSALHGAILSHNKTLFNELIHRGANVNQVTLKQETALGLAVKEQNIMMFTTLLLHGAKFSEKEIKNKKKLLKNLKSMNVTPHKLLDNGQTLLHVAARNGDLPTLQVLMTLRNAEPNISNKQAETIMHIAATKNNLQMVKWLDSQSEHLKNIQNRDDVTPLHIAVRSNNEEMVNFLVQSSKKQLKKYPSFQPNVNKKDKFGYTPLHSAVELGNKNIIGAILKLHPDLNSKNRDGDTPLSIAIKYHPQLISSLLGQGAKVENNHLKSAIKVHDLEAITMLLAHMKGGDIDNETKSILRMHSSQLIQSFQTYMNKNTQSPSQKIKAIEETLTNQNALGVVIHSSKTMFSSFFKSSPEDEILLKLKTQIENEQSRRSYLRK